MKTSTAKIMAEDQAKTTARIYLEDKAYDVLIGRAEPAKTGEVLREIGLEDATLRTVRYILGSSHRFESVDRRWTLAARVQDTQRPLERIIESIITAYGKPISLEALSKELSLTLDRPQEYYEEIIPRILSGHDKFFVINSSYYGLSSWLVTAESEEPEDVLFDNFMEESDVEPYRKAAEKISWTADDIAGSVEKLIDAVGTPLPVKVLAFYAWQELRNDYDPVIFYASLVGSDRLEILSTQKVLSPKQKQRLMEAVQALSAEVEEMPAETEEETIEAGPVSVSEADRDEIVSLVDKQGGTVTAEDILESVLEMSPGERGYQAAVESLRDALKDEERLIQVGPDRWRMAGTIPDYVFEIPPSLIIPPVHPYETPEGDIYDQELDDEGLEGGLKQEIFNPLVQDIGDEDPELTSYQPMDTYQRLALKYHHKEAGTMPLIQFNPEFFGTKPEIIHITLTGDGVRRDAWINNSTRLMYGLKDWYTPDMPVSGAAFEIHRTERPGEYRFVYDNRTDALVFVPTSRLLELLELKNEAESSEMPVFDIIVHILEHYKKGIGFVPLFTEVNLVKRVTRRLVASILSSYHCFHTRGKTGEWQYDSKKRSQGFNKAKRKYIKK